MRRISPLTASLALAATLALWGAFLLSPPPASACVGRKLVLGAVDGDPQGVVSRVLAILVRERTGTTVEVRFFPDPASLWESARSGQVDLLVGYALEEAQALGGKGIAPAEALAKVRRRHDEELNLVWGKPMGFSGRTASGADRGQAVPVVSKDTIKKFPALPRLLEKLGTRVVLDQAALESLQKAAAGGAEREEKAARAWLREVKLI